jgi:hypothetical protein
MTNAADMKRSLSEKVRAIKRSAGAALDNYEAASNAAPDAKLAADLYPKSAVLTSGLDAAVQVKNGNYGQAAVEAVGMVPFIKPGVTLAKMGAAALQRQALAKKAQAFDQLNDSLTYGAAKTDSMASGAMPGGGAARTFDRSAYNYDTSAVNKKRDRYK